mmetsp:Transcript_55693/g.156849  ORF Transcript_55693/g.156849 Transcript_55693/m.156849 type:complete len:160 (-) Transcript_55693:185-664(-)
MSRFGHIVWGPLSPIGSSNGSSTTNSSEGMIKDKPKTYGNVIFQTTSPNTSGERPGDKPSSDLAGSAENVGKKKQKRPSKKTRLQSKRVVEMLDLIIDPAEKQSCIEQLGADDPYMRLLCSGMASSTRESAAATAGGPPPSDATASSSKPRDNKQIIGI